MTCNKSRLVTVLAVLMVGALTVAPAASGEESDSRWHPWLGCWQLWEEQLDPTALSDVIDGDAAALLNRTFVCIRPGSSTDSVDLTAVAGERVLVERTLVADGERHDVQEAECTGWEQREWSFDGRRLFSWAELQCGDDTSRTVTGISLLTSSSIWVDIQVVDIGDRQLVEVRRYNPVAADRQSQWLGFEDALGVDPTDIRQARREAAAALDLRDVEEASLRTTARVVETMLVETEPRLPLDRDTLITLDDAGIRGGIIDLLVGLAYPDHFLVERRDRGGSWASNSYSGFGGFHDPLWYDRYYPYYVTPLGYYSWGRGYDPYLLGATATPFVVVPAVGAGAGVTEAPARAVHGRGYTRVSPRVPERHATPRGGYASPGGYSSGGGGGGSISRTGSGSSGGGSSSGGSGRTAVPR